jgi:hypothetical protein
MYIDPALNRKGKHMAVSVALHVSSLHSSIYHASHAPLGLRRESQCQKRSDAAETTNKARIRRLRSRDLKDPPGDKRGEPPSETRPLQILYAHLDKLNLLHLS